MITSTNTSPVIDPIKIQYNKLIPQNVLVCDWKNFGVVKLPLNTFSVILTVSSPMCCFVILFIRIGPTSTVVILLEVSFSDPHLIFSLEMLQLIGSSMWASSLNSQSFVITPLVVLQVSVSLIEPLNLNIRMSDRKSPVCST